MEIIFKHKPSLLHNSVHFRVCTQTHYHRHSSIIHYGVLLLEYSSEAQNISYTNPITQPHYTVLVDSKFTAFTLVIQSQPIDQLNVIFLIFSNLVKNTTSNLLAYPI